jgi:hypothetical protein
VSEVVFETFGWATGSFTFWERIPPPSTAVTLEMEIENLLLEGIRRVDVRSRLSELFPDLTMAVEAAVNPDRLKHTVTLTPEEWNVLFLLDGRRSLARSAAWRATSTRRRPCRPCTPRARAVRDRGAAAAARQHVGRAGAHPRGRPGRDRAQVLALRRVSVEFSSGMRSAKLIDDTNEIVTPKAVAYLSNTGKITVARLLLVADGRETSFPLGRDTYTLGPPPQQRHRDLRPQGVVLPRPHRPRQRGLHPHRPQEPQRHLPERPAHRDGRPGPGDEVRLGTAKLLYKVDYTSAS